MTSYIAPQKKLFGHLDHLAELRATGKTVAPVNVEIDLSNRCSLGCEWCHFAHTHTRGPLAGKRAGPDGAISGGDLMDLDLAKRIVDELDYTGVLSVTWTGGGEPTLYPHFDEIIEYTNLDQGLYTHGGHIDDTRAALLKRKLTWVYVSLDECTAAAYQTSKGADRFGVVCANVRRLVDAPGKATIGLGFLLHPDNWRDIHAMVKLGHSLGVDYVQFRPTIRFDMATPDQLAEETAWLDLAMAHLGAYAHDPFVSADLDRFQMYRRWQGHGYATCHWTGLQTVITPNGKVWRCTNKREHPGALLGDLSVESFTDVWGRSGGACQVDGTCRVMCRGHVPNVTLDAIMQPQAHANFI
jgi:MoaA/NifB/PqqE/SkfB family radical SAM enzyme